MASKKSPPKKKAASRKAPSSRMAYKQPPAPKRKSKMPSLGGGLMGLGGTGAQGMMP